MTRQNVIRLFGFCNNSATNLQSSNEKHDELKYFRFPVFFLAKNQMSVASSYSSEMMKLRRWLYPFFFLLLFLRLFICFLRSFLCSPVLYVVSGLLHPHSWLLSSGSSNRDCIQRETWDPMPELTVTSPYVDSRVDLAHVPWATCARVDHNPISESTLSPSQRQRIWPQASWCLELASPHPRPLFSYNSHNGYLAFLSLGLSFSLWKRWSSLFILLPSFPWICQKLSVQC